MTHSACGKSWLRAALRTSAATSALIAGMTMSAYAQDEAPPPAEEEDTIIVTGSRIPVASNLESSSPITQLGAEEFSMRGTSKVEDIINTLPQAFAAQGSNISNGASGTATVNLRGLGSDRTLVLIDGRRMPYGSAPFTTAADLNQIPAQLVERVEVVTGGASAVYGSDAMAGVVNFMMKRDFEGLRFNGQFSFFQHDNNQDRALAILEAGGIEPPDGSVLDGFGKDFSVIGGANTADGRGNVTAYFTYHHNKEVIQGERDYSRCAYGVDFDEPALADNDFISCVGSFTSPLGTFSDFANYFYTLDEEGPGDTFRNLDFDNDTYNYGPPNHYLRPDERFSFGAFAHYEINEYAEVYFDMMFHDDRSIAQIAPSGNFFRTSTIDCENPLLSEDQFEKICEADLVADIVDDPETEEDEVQDFIDAQIEAGLSEEEAQDLVDATLGTQACTFADEGTDPVEPCPLFIGRRNVEGDPRQDDLRHTSYRLLFGVRGETGIEGFTYDVYGLWSNVHLSENYLNEVSVSRMAKAIDVVDTEDGPQCRSVVDGTDPNCVPYDVFSIGGITQAALDYVIIDGLSDGNNTQQIVSGAITGDLGVYDFRSPWAETGFGWVMGAEYRRDTMDFRSDLQFCDRGVPTPSTDLAGQGGPTCPVSGATEVYEGFVELKVPFVENATFIKELTGDFGYRYSEYDLAGSTHTWKLMGHFAPTDDIRFRGGWQRAVRAPNVIELFLPDRVALFNLDDGDPCEGEEPIATLAQCQNSGVTAGQYGNIAANPAGQYNQFIGGNTDLEPETADTYTIGAVLTPTFVPNLIVSVDYFDIRVEDFIGTVPPTLSLQQCVETGDPFFCNFVSRNPTTGTLWVTTKEGVDAFNLNTGALSTRGIDILASYNFDFEDLGAGGLGGMNFELVSTYLLELTTEPLPDFPQAIFDCVGFHSGDCGTPNPDWRHRFRATWMSPWNLDVSVAWRYFAAVDSFPGTNHDFDSQNYVDLAARYQILDNVQLRAGVNNILDVDPPTTSVGAGFGNGNTYPQVYDAIGRYFFFAATVDF